MTTDLDKVLQIHGKTDNVIHIVLTNLKFHIPKVAQSYLHANLNFKKYIKTHAVNNFSILIIAIKISVKKVICEKSHSNSHW